MKIFFLVVLFSHGLLHFIGVTRAVRSATLAAAPGLIVRNDGFFWFTAASFLIAAAVGFTFKKEWWPFLALLGVIVSQIAIGLNWQEAKYGTIINLIVLLVSLNFLNQRRFDIKVEKEVAILRTGLKEQELKAPLPPIVQDWLIKSGGYNKNVTAVQISQQGKMRISQKSRWMKFKAEENFNLVNPGFIWKIKAEALPFVNLNGRDKLINGKGGMNIKLYYLLNVVDEEDNEKLNSGSMLRYLAEICWFPSAATASYLDWEQLDERSAKATFSLGDKQVSGIFYFSDEGMVKAFEGKRFFGTGEKATQEIWRIENSGIKEFEGIRIPRYSSIFWKLDSGDFHWLDLEITDLKYEYASLPSKMTASQVLLKS